VINEEELPNEPDSLRDYLEKLAPNILVDIVPG